MFGTARRSLASGRLTQLEFDQYDRRFLMESANSYIRIDRDEGDFPFYRERKRFGSGHLHTPRKSQRGNARTLPPHGVYSDSPLLHLVSGCSRRTV